MARKDDAKAGTTRTWVTVVRYSIRVVIAGSILVGGLYAYHRAEEFLLRDPRFVLNGPAEYGYENPSIEITGVRFASRPQVVRVFVQDFGRSLYQMPLAARRNSLRTLDWVKDASIARIWPNQIFVNIEERVPVAFLQMSGGADQAAKIALIDTDGVILTPPAQAQFKLPVVLGIRSEEPISTRRERVRRMQYMMKDVGSLADRISEVDVTDRDNLKVITRADNRAIVLLLGDRNYQFRLQNFVNHYPDIKRRIPNATTLDLRLEDRITVVEGNEQ